MSTSKATKKTTPKSKKSSARAKAPKPTSAELLFTPPHPDWNSPINARLGKLVLMLEDTHAAVQDFVNDVGEFPEGMFQGRQDEILQRLETAARVIGDQLCVIDSDRTMTDEEAVEWRSGGRYPGRDRRN